jgi:hypothetical protein
VLGSKLDQKSIGLILILSRLRDAIDIHRIISANAKEIKETSVSQALFGYLQISALESVAICFCKVFEVERRNELKSIPGIIRALPSLALEPQQTDQFADFGRKYGNSGDPIDPKAFLQQTLEMFLSAHSDEISQFKEFRDTIGAHSDLDASRETLPSHAEFEALFAFALDFYELVAGAIIGVGPASPTRRVGRGLLKLLQSLGVPNPRSDFPAEQ